MENNTLLVEKSRSGDREAFGRIVGKYQGMVSAVTLNIVGDYVQSEDLAQETFLTAWKRLSELRNPEKLASWLYGIARHVALRWRERQNRNPLKGAEPFDDKTAQIRIEAEQEQQRLQQREQSLQLVWSSVKELPEKYREPILLYYRYSRSVADIAETMRLSKGTVCQRLSRGRKMLKIEIEKQVESVLESTRPDTAFTLAVLASLPLAATVAGCSTTSKSLGLMSSGAAAGGSWFFSMLFFGAVVLSFLFHSLAGIAFTAITYYLLWLAIKKSPSCRTRRFVIAAAIDYNILIWTYILFYQIGWNFKSWDAFDLRYEFSSWFNVPLPIEATEMFFGGLPVFLVFTAFLLYVVLRWQKLLAEDQGILPQQSEKTPNAEEPVWSRTFGNEINIISTIKRKVRQWQDYCLTDAGIRRKRKIGMYFIGFFLFVFIILSVKIHVFLYLPTSNSSTVSFLIWFTMFWGIGLQIIIQGIFFVLLAKGIQTANLPTEETVLQNPDNHETKEIFYQERYSLLKNSLLLILALPIFMMFLSVALGFVREWTHKNFLDANTIYIVPLPIETLYGKVPFIVALVVATALWVSRNRAKRFLAFALLFLGVGLTVAFFVEWFPFFESGWIKMLRQTLFFWASESEKELWNLGDAEFGNMYLFWHIFTAVWLTYTLLNALMFYLLHRQQRQQNHSR